MPRKHTQSRLSHATLSNCLMFMNRIYILLFKLYSNYFNLYCKNMLLAIPFCKQFNRCISTLEWRQQSLLSQTYTHSSGYQCLKGCPYTLDRTTPSPIFVNLFIFRCVCTVSNTVYIFVLRTGLYMYSGYGRPYCELDFYTCPILTKYFR